MSLGHFCSCAGPPLQQLPPLWQQPLTLHLILRGGGGGALILRSSLLGGGGDRKIPLCRQWVFRPCNLGYFSLSFKRGFKYLFTLEICHFPFFYYTKFHTARLQKSRTNPSLTICFWDPICSTISTVLIGGRRLFRPSGIGEGDDSCSFAAELEKATTITE